MQACNLAQILRLTVVVLTASIFFTKCQAAIETQEPEDAISDMHYESETDAEFVRYYHVTIVNRDRLIVSAALVCFVILAAVITIRYSRKRRSDSPQGDK